VKVLVDTSVWSLAVSTIDLLICAAAIRREAALLSTDADFERYATVLPLRRVDP
jgi:predicted nucleic acid-binding protein